MKIIYSIFLLFLLVAGISAQTSATSSATSGILVLDNKWHVAVPYSELENEDPFRSNNDARQAQYDIKNNIRQNEIRARAGLPPQAPPARVRPVTTNPAAEESLAVYFYEVKVRNMTEKEINAITWEYVFFEKGTNIEVGRRRSISKATISPGKTKTLVMRSASPPSGSISAANAGKKLRDLYHEQIVIQSIEYADGTKWQSDTALSN